jgi:hypothetical protein
MDVPAIAVNRMLLARAGYYDKDKPSFLKANADYIGLLLSGRDAWVLDLAA